MQQHLIHARPFDNSETPRWISTITHSDRGAIPRLTNQYGSATFRNSSSAMDEVPALRPLAAKVEEVSAKIAVIAEETFADKIGPKVRPLILSLGVPFRDARYAVSRKRDEFAIDEASRESIPTTYDFAASGHALSLWRGMDHPQKLAAISEWPNFAIEAVMRCGQVLSGLSVQEWEFVRNRVRQINEWRIAKSDNPNFIRVPTAEEPTARGLDAAKVVSFVEQVDRTHALRVQSLNEADDMLRGVVLFAAVALGKSAAEAFALLNGTSDA